MTRLMRRFASAATTRVPSRLFRLVDVRRLGDAIPVHPPVLGQLARRLVPPDRPPALLLVDDLRFPREQVADERRVLGDVMARGEEHGRREAATRKSRRHSITAARLGTGA